MPSPPQAGNDCFQSFYDENCYKVYGGADRDNITKRVIISTWQSIYKLGHPWFQRFGMVVGDEAHQFKAKSFKRFISLPRLRDGMIYVADFR